MDFNTTQKHGVIYADPPWTFKTFSDKGKDKSPEKHYPCMSLSDIVRLPVDRIAKDDAVLLMWVVDPLLDKAFNKNVFPFLVNSKFLESSVYTPNVFVLLFNVFSLESQFIGSCSSQTLVLVSLLINLYFTLW